MADTEKKESGFLRAIWKIATSTPAKILYGFAAAAIVGPMLFDMGTWFDVFHAQDNLRPLAFRNAIMPYTSWIPYHMGLTEEGGLLYDLMSWFIEPELEELIADESAARAFDENMAQLNTPDSPSVTPAPSGPDEDCDIFGTCEAPPAPAPTS